MGALLVIIIAVALIVWVLSQGRTATPTRDQATAGRPEFDGSLSDPPAWRTRAERRTPIPFATPGMRGSLFTYGGDGHASLVEDLGSTFAVVDLQTTGLSPDQGDRIIEVAVVRVEDGVIGHPWSTLVNPGRDTGATFIHHIEDADVANAPTFGEVAPYLLSQLDGAVVVAHHAPFDEAFLVAELKRAGFTGARMPAICSLWLARQSFDTPNHRLPTLARELDLRMATNYSHDQVLATAAVLLHGLGTTTVRHGCAAYVWDGGPVQPPRVVTRVRGLRKGADGYMSGLMAKLPAEAAEVTDAAEDAYLELLETVMADGQITRVEAEELGKLAGQIGMDRDDVRGLNERFLERMREAAFADEVLTATELRELRRGAKALGVPSYFDDLQLTPGAAKVMAAPGVRKCGHCGQPGHYRPKCPDLIAG